MQQLVNNGNMSSNENTTSSNPANTTNTNPTNSGQPVFNIYGNQAQPTNQANQAPDTSKQEPQKQVEPTPEQKELETLRKQNKILTEANLTSLRNEIAPVELFEKEDDHKNFIKDLGDDLDKITWFRNVAKQYVPKMIALYEKTKAEKKPEGTEQKKDEKGNPLAASKVELPRFNNDSTVSNNPLEDLVKKHSLKELFTMNRRMMRTGGNE